MLDLDPRIESTAFQVPFPPRESAPRPEVVRLEAALLSPDPMVLRSMSASGELEALIPEWGRMTGPENIQHATHHFPLDEHTFRVVERTKQSPYYQRLTHEQRRMVTLAALLHDIDKHAGPEGERGAIPVDRAHPEKSARMSRTILRRLGYPFVWIERLSVLITDHQAFGVLIIRHGEHGVLPEGDKIRAAVRLRFPGAIPMLRALTEGDIRGVQAEDALFTPRVAERLAQFSTEIEAVAHRLHEHMVYLPKPRFEGLMPLSLAIGVEAAYQVTVQRAYWMPELPENRLSTVHTFSHGALPEQAGYWVQPLSENTVLDTVVPESLEAWFTQRTADVREEQPAPYQAWAKEAGFDTWGQAYRAVWQAQIWGEALSPAVQALLQTAVSEPAPAPLWTEAPGVMAAAVPSALAKTWRAPLNVEKLPVLLH